MISPKSVWSLVKESFKQFSDDYAPSMGAALAYYTVFSIAPLLVIAIAVAGFFFGADAARGEIFDQLRGLIGDQGASAIEAAVANANQSGKGLFATIAGIGALVLGATTVFSELQSDLDRIWDSPQQRQTGIWGMLRGRLLSFGMVLGIGFLLLVSLVVSAALAALAHFSSGWFPGWEVLLRVVNLLVGFLVVTGLFAMIYKLLPRCDIGWKDVWVGAAVTSLLFSIGKFLIGLYLGKSSVASSFGAAGSLVIVLLWVYFSSQIFLLGAEFTWVYSYRHGTRMGKPRPAMKGVGKQAAAASESGRVPAQNPVSEPPLAAAPEPIRSPAGATSPVREPALTRLRIAAGIAAAVGLLAGELANELRRRPLTRAPRRT
ncbi:MAG: YhjD/YihY/BrkB family envelope integrity protein [Rudaea sp.]